MHTFNEIYNVPAYVTGCDVQVYSDEQSNFQGMFFQDK